MLELPQPWLEDSLEHLDLRRRDRCLVLGCPTRAHLGAVSQVIGQTAAIVVVEPDRELAEMAAEARHQNLEVLHYTPRGGERFGVFDALLACPLTTMGWSLSLWADLVVHNLRPGGRFVLDLPAESVCEPLRRAWRELGADEAVLAPLRGPTQSEAAEALRDAGLRSVEAALGTHLVHLEDCRVLVDLAGTLPGVEADQLEDLHHTLVGQFRGLGAVDVVYHRTRVHGLR